MEQQLLILDFGSQYTQLIARRIRELNVYCEIHPYNAVPELTPEIKGIILSGSPCSVREDDAPIPDLDIFGQQVPVLGICYGAQLMAKQLGGEVEASKHREYGRAGLELKQSSELLNNMDAHSQVWMSHGDTITQKPTSIDIIASTDSVEVAAFKVHDKNVYGIQFHPEVTHSLQGRQLLQNFVVDICGCDQSWTAAHFIDSTVAEIRERVGTDEVILGLSGGVDSSVAAALIHKAIGDQLKAIFVNNGLLRKDEYHQVLDTYRSIGLNVTGVDASDEFLDALEGVTDPERKRKIIGAKFIDVFDREAHKFSNAKWLAQGTIYPDVIESVSVKGPSATIKSHHNVGGLPERMKLKLLEPLNTLFKDEVRRIGREAGVPEEIISRHPFPGPGLAIRILGSITREKVRITQEADAIFIHGLKSSGLYDDVWQAGAIFLPIQSVGVMGDERTYEHVICLRAVTSVDGMTADWVDLPHSFLADVSNRIINNIKGINRVVYDVSSKPPATIEWE
ncbi:MAG: glutamine-hydrolyzing GMP synthase [Flavobacteriales bacterium]|nr:glutamine-hydrolyzing GMP synthase [Bacteroidota bacterium]MCB9241710.1 glutamine-hydrolyzing GMP synthase [Flavobacteriales bacterium]